MKMSFFRSYVGLFGYFALAVCSVVESALVSARSYASTFLAYGWSVWDMYLRMSGHPVTVVEQARHERVVAMEQKLEFSQLRFA